MDETALNNLRQLKQRVYAELTPLLESASFSPLQKFNILFAAARTSGDHTMFERAFQAANAIEKQDDKANALLDLLDTIDENLGELFTRSAIEAGQQQ